MGTPAPPPSYAPVVVMQCWQKKCPRKRNAGAELLLCLFISTYRAFSHDLTVAILVFQNKETAAMFSDVGVPNQSGGS